jgi:hypothetical protein
VIQPINHQPLQPTPLGRRIILHNTFYFPIICIPVLLVGTIGLRLRGTVQIGLVQQRLDAQEYLFQRDGRLPAWFILLVLLIQDRQADGAGGIHVRMVERGNEFCAGRFAWVFWRGC